MERGWSRRRVRWENRAWFSSGKQLEGGVASRRSSVPLSGFGDNLLICGGERLPHAKRNSRYARFLHAGPEGNLISTELWVSSDPDVLAIHVRKFPEPCFSPPLRMHYIKDLVGRKHSALLPFCRETASNFAQFLFILQTAISYPSLKTHLQELIRSRWNVLLLFPCMQNPFISLFLPPRLCVALLKGFYETQLGKRGNGEAAYKYVARCDLTTGRWSAEERRWQWKHRAAERE